VNRWLGLCICVLGISFPAHAGESLKPVSLADMARFAIDTRPNSRLTIPIRPEIAGEIDRLRVIRKHKVSKRKIVYEMRCMPTGSCAFPFIVIVERPQKEELPPEYVLAKGDLVVLKLIRKGYSAELITVCLEHGGIDDEIKVKTIDGKQNFDARVIDHELVVSEL
jgi:hypothetical protein